jgi:A/G-specific adenine glycosylase
MELGSQVCKPVSPLCSECPLQSGCKAYAEVRKASSSSPGLIEQTTTPLPSIDSDECTLCAPMPSTAERATIPTVMIFPMKKEKKVSRSEDEVVCVTEWVYNDKRSWLFVKRPEKGESIVVKLL